MNLLYQLRRKSPTSILKRQSRRRFLEQPAAADIMPVNGILPGANR
jgi:hypothetical protein